MGTIIMIAEQEKIKEKVSIRHEIAGKVKTWKKLLVFSTFILFAASFLRGMYLLGTIEYFEIYRYFQTMALYFTPAAFFFVSGGLAGKAFIAEVLRKEFPGIQISTFHWKEKDVEKYHRKIVRKFNNEMGWNEKQIEEARASITAKKQKQIDSIEKYFTSSNSIINSLLNSAVTKIAFGLLTHELKKSATFFLSDINELENLENLYAALPLTEHVDRED